MSAFVYRYYSPLAIVARWRPVKKREAPPRNSSNSRRKILLDVQNGLSMLLYAFQRLAVSVPLPVSKVVFLLAVGVLAFLSI